MEINKTSCVRLRFASSTGLQSRSLIRMPLIRTDGNFHPWRKYLLSAKVFVTFIKSQFIECESSRLIQVFTLIESFQVSILTYTAQFKEVHEKIECLENK